MIFRQLLHEGLAAASYLVGCVAKGEAAVVDPSLSAETYTALAAEKGLQIVAVFETHMHADFFSTGRAIAALTGATMYVPRLADVQFPHQPIDDGDVVNIGNLVIQAVHTPGHTPEHTAYAVSDTPRSNAPWFVGSKSARGRTRNCRFVRANRNDKRPMRSGYDQRARDCEGLARQCFAAR